MEKGNSSNLKKDDTEGFQCLEHSNWTICTPLDQFCETNFNFFTFILGGQFLLPQRANNREKGINPTLKLDETGGLLCLGHSNWTICSLISHFCPKMFENFPLSYWGPILITPDGQLSEKGILPAPKLDETEGFHCLGHSNWTICSLLSPFFSENFSTFPLSYWGANSYYPRGPIIRKGSSSNSKIG